MTKHKVYLTGAEVDTQRASLIGAECSALTISYPHFIRNSKAKQAEILSCLLDNGISVYLDSGSEYQISKIRNHMDFSGMFEQAVYKYLEYVDTNSDYFDIVNVLSPTSTYVSPEVVCLSEYSDICKEYVLTLPLTALDKERGQDFIRSLPVTNDFYVGLEGGHQLGDYRRYINGSQGFYKKRGIRFALHGVSDSMYLRNRLFDFVTCNAWLMGARYKAIYQFRGNSISRIVDTNTPSAKRSAIKRRLSRNVSDIGVDVDAFMEDDFDALNAWNASQFVAMQKYELSRYDKTHKPPVLRTSVGGNNMKKKTHVNTEESSALVRVPDSDDNAAIEKFERKRDYMSQPIVSIKRQCNTCEYQDVCPAFVADSECSLEGEFDFSTDADVDVLIERQLGLRAVLVERMNVGQKFGFYTPDEVNAISASLTSDAIKYKKVRQKANDFTITGNAAGISAFGDLITGLVATSQSQSKGSSKAANDIEMSEMKKETEDIYEDAEFVD